MNRTDKTTTSTPQLQQLDALTAGAFSAPTSGERAARLRDWLTTQTNDELMADVYREMSRRDKGAAKVLKERLDDIKRAKAQDAIASEWAARAQALLAQPRLPWADAMAWQRDAAKAGAPLSREPLAGLKQALAERMTAIEDLQHQVQVEREAAVLLAQRIEVLSTKSWTEAQGAVQTLSTDVAEWLSHAAALPQQPHWPSIEPKFATQLESSRLQLAVVWDAFQAALAQAVAAAADAQAALPAVPVWADELRAARGALAPAPAATDTAELLARRAQAQQHVRPALVALLEELAQGQVKTVPKAISQLRQLLKEHGRHIGTELEQEAHQAIAQAGDLEGWQRWRADQLRTELLAKAEALTRAPEGQRLGGRKMQEALRELRAQWKASDQGGPPNHALWKKFDEACNDAYKVVESWLTQLKQHNEAARTQRLELISEIKSWSAAHEQDVNWKQQLRDLQAYAERWRQGAHLSEKLFAELQPLWKDAWSQAQARLQAAQTQSVARRQDLIAAALQLGQAPVLRMDAVKDLQQQWQQEAHAVPLERRQEQQLWEAFRQPIDAAFARRSASREQAAAALGAHDQSVLEAAQALLAANASGDAQRIRQAMSELQSAAREHRPATAGAASPGLDAGAAAKAELAPVAAAGAPAPKLVARRGDDRPGPHKPATMAERQQTARDGRDSARAARSGPSHGRHDRGEREPAGPRLGEAAFRAQRQALEQAELALNKLAAQAHGEALTQLLSAWERRQAEQLPTAQALGGKSAGPARAAWAQALGATAPAAPAPVAEALLRLEMASETPTPAAFLEDRRALQLRMLTRRNDPTPAQTWVQDTAQVLASAYTEQASRRLQAALKVLLRR